MLRALLWLWAKTASFARCERLPSRRFVEERPSRIASIRIPPTMRSMVGLPEGQLLSSSIKLLDALECLAKLRLQQVGSCGSWKRYGVPSDPRPSTLVRSLSLGADTVGMKQGSGLAGAGPASMSSMAFPIGPRHSNKVKGLGTRDNQSSAFHFVHRIVLNMSRWR
jgi:hypothetical protein